MRICTVFLFVAFVTFGSETPGRASPPAHCEPGLIREFLEASGKVPDLTECSPVDVRSPLQAANYGLRIDKRYPSATIAPGLIVSQRVQSRMVGVDVSTGPAQDPTQAGGGHAVGSPDDQSPQPPPFLLNVLKAFAQALPPLHPQGSTTLKQEPPNPVPAGTLAQVVQLPPKQAPPSPPPNDTEPPPMAPVTQASAQPDLPPTETAAAAPAATETQTQGPDGVTPLHNEVAQAAPHPLSPTTAPAPTPHPVAVAPQPQPNSPVAQPAPSVTPQPRSVAQFSILGSPRVTEGKDLEFIIRRLGNDRSEHQLDLSYNDPLLLGFAPAHFDFHTGPPDRATLRLPTVAGKRGDGDHQLVVTISNADPNTVGSPNSATATILGRPSFWLELVSKLRASAALTLALGATIAAAGLGLVFVPRATCSIGVGKPGLGSGPLQSHWPSVDVTTTIGSASASIPHPLPIEKLTNA